MAHAVSRRSLTTEARVWSQVSPCGIYVGQSGNEIGFSPSTWFSHVNFIPPLLHYKENRNKFNCLHHRFAQNASILQRVRSICCGALHHKKKRMSSETFFVKYGFFVVYDRRITYGLSERLSSRLSTTSQYIAHAKSWACISWMRKSTSSALVGAHSRNWP